jgi:uncharacterized protein YcbX
VNEVRGRLIEIWRHPVKSMQGERVDATRLGPLGVPGDRGWAIRDEARGGIVGAKKIAALMQCRARYLDAPTGAEAVMPAPEIETPDGARFRADAADANERLGAAIGRKVTLHPRHPASDLAHYLRAAPDSTDMETELRAIFGREKDEPLPDLSVFPPEIFQYESPPGTYFDAFPVLFVTDASLRRLAELAPASRIDVRRFRPNFVLALDGAASGFPEADWRGRTLRIGEARLDVGAGCPRCVMITHPFADLPKDPALMRTVVREANQNVGAYATIATPGAVRVGDEVVLED